MALINKLEAIGDAVRAKTGDTDKLTLDEMATKINGLKPGPTESDLTITGDISWFFNRGRMLDFNAKFPFIFKDITSIMDCFANVPLNRDLSSIVISTAIFDSNQIGADASGCFQNQDTNSLPVINGAIRVLGSITFRGNYYLQDDKIRTFLMNSKLKLAWRGPNSISGNPGLDGMFQNCKSLRNINDILLYIHQWFINHPIEYSGNLSDYYFQSFSGCTFLDEVCNIPIFEFPNSNGNTYNIFNYTFDDCSRVKNITFCTNNGVPYIKKWKNQTLDFANRTGYGDRNYLFQQPYNSGITMDKEVIDDTTYAALKNDPDWFTCNIAYSRYNHDSAVATINSLPDTSEYLAANGGTNTIKFKGAAGEKTDGGAINTLTAEEIAVAAAKGWTVTLV